MGYQGISGDNRIGYLSILVLFDVLLKVGKFCGDIVVRVPFIDFLPQVAGWMTGHI